MRTLLIASFLALNLGLIARAELPSKTPDSQVSTSAPIYRGKPLAFYVQQAHTENVQPSAIRAIGSFGADAVSALPTVVSALQSSSVDVRIAAAWAITQIAPAHDSSTVHALARIMSDPSPQVRALAAVALRNIGPTAAEAVPTLIAGLNDPDAFVRAPSADALGAIGPAARAAVEPLAEHLRVKNEQIFVLRSVAYALGNIGPDARAALPALQESLKMVRVVYAAQEAISKITGKPAETYR